MTEVIRLSEAAFVNPKGPRPGEISGDELCDFVPMASVREDGSMAVEEQRPYRQISKGYTPFRSGDVLLAKITPCFENGKIALATTNTKYAFGSTEFHVIRSQKDKLDSRYLFHFLRQPQIRIDGENKMTGSAGQKRVPRNFLDELAIPLPSRDVQRRIVAILDKADAVRRKREQGLALAADFLRSVFLAMFGDPVRNAKGLPKQPLGKFGTIVTGNTPPRSDPENFGDAIEWIKSDNVNTEESFLTRAVEGLSEKGKALGRVVPEGSILVTCIAGSPSSIGRAAIADRPVAFNQQINAITPNSDVNLYFLYSQFLIGKSLVLRSSTNSMKGMISKGEFQKIEFLCPELNEQERFGRIFEKQIEASKLLREASDCSADLFRALSQRAFRDEL